MTDRHSAWLSRFIAAATAVATLAALPLDADAAIEPSAAGSKDLCAGAVGPQESRSGIPKKLLTAISLVESGRWDAETGKGVAWPWTVTAEGKGRFFPTKAAAIAAVRRLQARGVTSIDVGCMQVNLHYHPSAFASLDEAFDPGRNVAYGAKFLSDLKRDHGNWQQAVQHYHSSSPERRIPYQRKVYAAWRGAAAETEEAAASDSARMRRIGRQVERDHRAKVSAFQRLQRQAEKAETADGASQDAGSAPLFLSSWPPRDARAQLRAQNLARAWAFGGAARNVRQ
jgi:soluble lytic murein transglycosylase-like protein